MKNPEKILQEAAKRHFYGLISFKFQNGEVVLVTKNESFLPEEAEKGLDGGKGETWERPTTRLT